MKKILVVFALCAILICAPLFGCSFVKYNSAPTNEEFALQEEVSTQKANYVQRLIDLSGEDKYREAELPIYKTTLREGVNAINECTTLDTLSKVFAEFENEIKGIKTDAEYKAEEDAALDRLNAEKQRYIKEISSINSEKDFRSPEKENFSAYVNEAINKIEECAKESEIQEIFDGYAKLIGALKLDSTYVYEENLRLKFYGMLCDVSASEDYREREREDYFYYLEKAREEMEKWTEEEQLNYVYEAYKEVIEGIKTDAEYLQEEYEALVAYKTEAVKNIKEYVDLLLYREEEQGIICSYIEISEKAIIDAVDYKAVDDEVRAYKAQVYQCKTDAELYEDELEELKAQTLEEIGQYYNEDNYRQNEKIILLSVKNNYSSLISATISKDSVEELVIAYKDIVDSIKTDKVLYAEEKAAIIEQYYNQLINLGDLDNKEQSVVEEYTAYCDDVRTEMYALETKELVSVMFLEEKERIYITLAKSGDVESLKQIQEIYVTRISNLVDLSEYRIEEQNTINGYIAYYSTLIEDTYDYDTIISLENESREYIFNVMTNEEMWIKEDDEFIARMNAKYGQKILEPPSSLFQADNYYELASIIDWYAFYQLDYQSFERSSFRIKLNYEHRSAQYEINEVYWYCELIRGAVGITGKIENSDYLVVELIPYAIGSVQKSNNVAHGVRYSNLVEFDSDKSTMQSRSSDFSDFGYKNYTKIVKDVWNTQQLWYALEHDYYPECVTGSIAEISLRKAEDILRSIILEGMSDEEKIFSIYTWSANNIDYDTSYLNDLETSDRYKFPDEKVALSDTFFIEGALNGAAVCEGYAKSYLLLLRLEGIESYRICYKTVLLKGINALYTDWYGYGSHALVAVKGSDGKFYYSDTESSYSLGLITYHQLMVKPSLFIGYNGYTQMYPDMEFAYDICNIYSRLKVHSTYVYVTENTDLQEIFQIFDVETENNIQLSIVVDTNICNIRDIILSYNNFTGVVEKHSEDEVNSFTEYVIYKRNL